MSNNNDTKGQAVTKVPCICCSHSNYDLASFTGVVELISSIGYPFGTKLWLTNGKKHREDGPAVEKLDGKVEYFLFGNKMTKTEWEKEVKTLNAENSKHNKYFSTYENPSREITDTTYTTVKKNRPDFTGWATFAWWRHQVYQGFYENGMFTNLMGPAIIDLDRKLIRHEFWIENKQYHRHSEYFKAVVDKVPHVDRLKDLKASKNTGIFYCKETNAVYMLENGKPKKNLPGFPNVLRAEKYNENEVLDEENGLNMEHGQALKLEEYLTTFETKPRSKEVKEHGKIYGYEEVEQHFPDLNGWIAIPWFFDGFWTCHFINGVVSNLMGPAAINKNGEPEFWINGKIMYQSKTDYFKAVKKVVKHYERLVDLKENKHSGVAYCKETDRIYLLKDGKPTKNIDKIPYNTMNSQGQTEDLGEDFKERKEEEEVKESNNTTTDIPTRFTQEVWAEYLKGYKTSTKIINSLVATKKEKFTGWAQLSWCNYYAFFVDGVYHNEAGPAAICVTDSKNSEYWLDGIRYNETNYYKELEKRTRVINDISKIPVEFTIVRNSEKPGQFFLYHGSKKFDNVEGLPNSFGSVDKCWRDSKGDLHREDGPAVIKNNGAIKEYWLHGINFTFENWKEKKKSFVNKKQQNWDKTFSSVSETRQHEGCCSSCVRRNFSDGWVNYKRGESFWHLKNGNFHNLAGPAVVNKNGTKEYWIEGIRYETRKAYLEKLKTIVPWITTYDTTFQTSDRGLTGTVYDPGLRRFAVWKDGKLFIPSETDTNPQPNLFFEEEANVEYEYRDAKGSLSNKHGPARVYKDGTKEYWIDGVKFQDKNSWDKAVNNKNLTLEAWLNPPDSAETPDYFNLNSSQRTTYTGWVKSNGNYYFLENGRGHCYFGPAVLDKNLSPKEYRIKGETKTYKDWFLEAKKALERYDISVVNQKKTAVVVRWDNDIETYLNGKRQSINKQPSVLTIDTRIWEKEDLKTHRENDLPAVEWESGRKEWFRNGERHRDGDLPALVVGNEQHWYRNGQRHRENDKPAIVNTETGVSQWFAFDKRHRENGPAVYNEETGESQFYLNNRSLTNVEYEIKNSHKTIDTNVDSTTVVYGKIEKNNMTSKLLNGKLHCVTGPAVTHENGDVEYWINGTQYSEKDFFLRTKTNHYLRAYSSYDLKNYTGWAYWAGYVRFYKDGKLDTPPVKNQEDEIPTYEQWGEKYFYKNGKLVKKIVSGSGDIYRYNTRGQYHSPDNDTPAYEKSDRSVLQWYKNGRVHREGDLPAVINKDTKYWYKEDQLHRTTGPAAIYSNGTKEYWVNSRLLTEEEFYKTYATVTRDGMANFRNESIPKTFTGTCLRKDDKYIVVNGQLHSETEPAFVSKDGKTQKWYVNGKPHREDGPAVVLASGETQYWVGGKLHRLDGPAIIRADGTKEYWIDGKLHSNKGAAKTFANGIREYVLNGTRLSKREWQKLTNPISNDAKDAAYRIARNQLVKVVREFLADEISKKTTGKTKKEEARNTALEFLSSEVGVSVVFGAIGILLPKLADKLPGSVQPHLERLNKEFRVSAMTTIGNEAVNLLTSSIVLGKTKEILCRLDKEAEQKITLESVELHKSTQPLLEENSNNTVLVTSTTQASSSSRVS